MAGSSWTNQVQNTVIVGGSNAGVFVYSGSPAAGNPPIFWATSAAKDPFGNTIPQGSTSGIAAAGTFVAGNTIVNTSGVFTYSSTPAANNLVASLAPAAGTDAFGNQYVAGEASYSFQSIVASFATAHSGGVTTWYTAAAGTFGPWTSIATAKTVSVAPTGLIITAGGEVELTNGTASLFVGTAAASNRVLLQGDVWITRPSSLSGRAPPTLSDNGHFTTTTTGDNQLTNQWTIPGLDASLGTEYRVSAYGNVTMPGASLQAPHWAVNAFGSNVATVAVAAAALSAGVVYQWQLTARVTINATGASGTMLASTAGSLAAAGVNLLPGTAAQNAVALAGLNTGTTIDTTASTTISVVGGFAAGSAGQSLDCYASSFERIGA